VARRRIKGNHVRIAAGVLYSLLFLFPIFWMVQTSFKQQVDIFTSPADIVLQPTLALRRILQRADIVGGFQHGHRRGWGGSSLDRRWRDVGFCARRIKLRGAHTSECRSCFLVAFRPSPGGPDVPCRTQFGMADKHITLILAYCTFSSPM